MRATFQDRDTAALMGIHIGTIHTATFALGFGPRRGRRRAARAGVRRLPDDGRSRAAKAFAIVILGGLGNIAGATVGGFILALVEELGAGYVSSGYRDAMGFLLIIVILALPADGAVRAEGAHRVKRRPDGTLARVPVLDPAVDDGPVRAAHPGRHRHLHHRGDEPQPAARLHRPALARPRRVLRHRRLRERARVARLQRARRAGRRRSPSLRSRSGAGCSPRSCVSGASRLVHRPDLVQGPRRVLRHRVDQLRRGGAPGRGQLGRADAGADGAQQHSAAHAVAAGRGRACVLEEAGELLADPRRRAWCPT